MHFTTQLLAILVLSYLASARYLNPRYEFNNKPSPGARGVYGEANDSSDFLEDVLYRRKADKKLYPTAKDEEASIQDYLAAMPPGEQRGAYAQPSNDLHGDSKSSQDGRFSTKLGVKDGGTYFAQVTSWNGRPQPPVHVPSGPDGKAPHTGAAVHALRKHYGGDKNAVLNNPARKAKLAEQRKNNKDKKKADKQGALTEKQRYNNTLGREKMKKLAAQRKERKQHKSDKKVWKAEAKKQKGKSKGR